MSAPFDLFFQFAHFFDVCGKPVEDYVEDASDLAGGHKVVEQVIKDFRVLFYRIRQGGAFLDVLFDLSNNSFEIRVVLLVLENLQALNEREAGIDHGRKLPDEYDYVLVLDSSAYGREIIPEVLGLLSKGLYRYSLFV